MARKLSFICPYCQTFAHVDWVNYTTEHRYHKLPLAAAFCHSCNEHTVWYGGEFTEEGLVKPVNRPFQRLYPIGGDIPPPNPDMPESIRSLYLEAARISTLSPRGAAAILRLCLQDICNILAKKDDTIDNNLHRLKNSEDPIPERFIKAADTVRVIGNEAVHPGFIDFEDNKEIANDLFTLINSLIENQISQLKIIDSIINKQPETVKAKITSRVEQKKG